MAFEVHDYRDLVRLLTEHPEWRPELRRLLLTDELLELPQIVRELAEAQRRSEDRLSRVEEHLAALAEAQRRSEVELAGLAQAQRLAEERLSSAEGQLRELTSIVLRLNDTVSGIRGQLLEMDYERKVAAYFGPFLRRPRVINLSTLLDTLETRLSSDEFRDVLLLDLLVCGQPRIQPDASDVWLAVEISAMVDKRDVERARRRADSLRQAGYRTIPMVAGERFTEGAGEAIQAHRVAVLEDGKVVLWEQALQTWTTQ